MCTIFLNDPKTTYRKSASPDLGASTEGQRPPGLGKMWRGTATGVG